MLYIPLPLYLGGKAAYLEKQRDKRPFIVSMQVLHKITVSCQERSSVRLDVVPDLLTGEGYRPKRDRRNRKDPYRRVKGRY